MNPLMKRKGTTEKVAKKVQKAVAKHPTRAAAAGIAAATAVGTAVGAAAWLRGRRNAANGATFHVESDGNGSWQLREEGVDEPLQRHERKRDAVDAARKYARGHNPSVLEIHVEDGKVTRRHSYDAR
jgi:endonuclease YncB( thermonuclease family)